MKLLFYLTDTTPRAERHPVYRTTTPDMEICWTHDVFLYISFLCAKSFGQCLRPPTVFDVPWESHAIPIAGPFTIPSTKEAPRKFLSLLGIYEQETQFHSLRCYVLCHFFRGYVCLSYRALHEFVLIFFMTCEPRWNRAHFALRWHRRHSQKPEAHVCRFSARLYSFLFPWILPGSLL